MSIGNTLKSLSRDFDRLNGDQDLSREARGRLGNEKHLNATDQIRESVSDYV